MKTIYKEILPCILAFEILIVSFFSCSIPVNAADFMPNDIVQAVEYGIEYNDWEPFYRFLYNSADGLMYLVSQMGAVTTKDFQTWVDNNKKLESLVETVPAKKEGENIVFTKEFMTQLKTILDDYAKEHEPYYMVNTLTLDDLLSDYVGAKLMYDTAKNLIEDSPSGVIAFGAYYSRPTQMFFADVGHDFTSVSPVRKGTNNLFVNFYNNESWNFSTYIGYEVNLNTDGEAIKTAEEFKEKAVSTYQDRNIGQNFRVYPEGDRPGSFPYDCRNSNGWLNLITKEPRRIRVFNTYADFQNYTLGKRSVYYTKDYYSYVPEDLTTSIDDLQQTVDDLSGVIDQLLGQITDTTDESEIEDLLKQILDELKNNQGGGSGGGGSGGGDVNVDIDLSTTNTLLSKILAKVTQIFDRMSETVEGAADTAHAKIQETLDEILVQIKKLKHWTMADTAVNAADAVADWLDFIKGIFDDAENGAGSAVSALSSTMGDAANLMKTKFPFCIPWDVYLIIGFLAEEPQTPVFRLPIKLERLGIEEYIEIDLKDFDAVSSISRTLLTVLYCYGLLNLTMKVFPVAKEGD